MAAERGLVMRIPPVQTRTRRAHEAAAFARTMDTFSPVHHALFRAVFEYGRDVNDTEVLVPIVQDAGLSGDDLRMALGTRGFSEIIDADAALAEQLRIRSVPVMVVADASGRTEPVLGAVPYDWLEGAINRAIERTEKRAG
jgi:predicted DsbA family dithiol-disulfide isomerase